MLSFTRWLLLSKKKFLLLLISIHIPFITPFIASSEEILKIRDKDGKVSYTNIETNRYGTNSAEIIRTTSRKADQPVINYQIENLFNDSNTETGLLTGLQKNRDQLAKLLSDYGQQLEETQFELNANTVTLDRCYINPVYDYLVLFCSGLELKQQRLLNELDLISNSMDNIRAQVIALDLQINELRSQNKSEVCVVKEIVSGDSFICAFGKGLRAVKMIGIEAPGSSAGFLESLILGKKVLLRFDTTKTDLDNNILSYVFIDDTTMLNALLLRQGMALALSDYNYKYIYEFNEYEKLAKENKNGIWAN